MQIPKKVKRRIESTRPAKNATPTIIKKNSNPYITKSACIALVTGMKSACLR